MRRAILVLRRKLAYLGSKRREIGMVGTLGTLGLKVN